MTDENINLVRRNAAREIIRAHAPCLISFSGGVDSSVLLAVALQILGPEKCRAVIVDTPAVPRDGVAAAIQLATRLGANVEVIADTGEFADADFLANSPERCYFCKRAWFAALTSLAKERGLVSILHGENACDDPADRPGSRAAVEYGIVAPLRDAGITKNEVRQWARELGLPNADVPSAPCLSTRILYGSPITIEKLSLAEKTEKILREKDFSIVRARIREEGTHHAVLLQVAPDETPRLLAMQKEIAALLAEKEIGRVSFSESGYSGPGLT